MKSIGHYSPYFDLVNCRYDIRESWIIGLQRHFVIFDEDTPAQLIEAIRPDVLVKGGDYTPETIVGHDFVESYGGKVAIFPRLEGLSTTEMVRKIRRQGDPGSDTDPSGCGQDLAGKPPGDPDVSFTR